MLALLIHHHSQAVFFCILAILLMMGVAVLVGATGLWIFLLRSRLCLKLHAVTLWGAIASLACFLFLVVRCGEGLKEVLVLGLPALAVGSGLIANSAWGKGRIRALPADLGEEEHLRAVDRLGRRIWFPLMLVVGAAGGYLGWIWFLTS